MFKLPMLPIPRQRNVGNALAEHFKANPPYPAKITERAEAVIAATGALGTSDGAGFFQVDVATDGVVSAMYRLTQDVQKGLVASVVQLDASQQAMFDAAATLEQAWFPNGVGFIHDVPGLQFSAMNEIRKTLSDPQQAPTIKAAVATLGIGPLVDHFLAHVALYAKKLRLSGEVATAAEAEPLEATEVWHAAFLEFAVAVAAEYAGDPVARETLTGPYERELSAHRADEAKERKRARKAKATGEK